MQSKVVSGDKKGKNGDTEDSLFRNELKGTRPIKSPRIDPRGKPPSPKPRFSGGDVNEPVTRGVIIYDHTPGHGAEDYINYSTDGPQKKLLKKLRKGQLPREAVLDLHRKTLQDAAQTVHDFLQAAIETGHRCVLVIHGKGLRSQTGEPKMKNQLALWLQNHDGVLAFCSALPEDGGNGALYVLLRRS